MSKQEIAPIVEPTLPSVVNTIDQDAEVLGSLLKLPRLSLTQKMSKAVEAEKAKAGDFFENLTDTVICPKDKPFNFVPLKVLPVLTTYKIEGVKKVFEKQVPLTAANQDKEWDEEVNGVKYKHLPEVQVYLLAEADLANDNPFVLPFLFTFRGASMPTGGKPMYTFTKLLKAKGIELYKYVFTMKSDKKEKDGNTFNIAVLNPPTQKTDEKHFKTCQDWVDTLTTMKNVQVADDNDLEADLGGKPIQEQF